MLTLCLQALIDDIINSINILVFKATDAVEKGLLSADPANLGFKVPPQTSTEAQEAAAAIQEKAKLEIENGVHQLETLLEAKIDKNFDKLEVWALRNVLSVPSEVRDWVRLSHYDGLTFVNDIDAPNTESIILQRRKLRETQKLHSLLVAETEKNDATIASLKAILMKNGTTNTQLAGNADTGYPSFAFLQNKGDLTDDVAHPISATTSFTLSQLPALKTLLQNLRPRLEELAKGDGKQKLIGEEEKSWRRERLEFVERETRRHLESVRGLELGDMGEVRDGEWQKDGRQLEKGEVEDLETVVGMVDGVEAMDEGT
jgi:kinetochore protein Mis12/MTW1